MAFRCHVLRSLAVALLVIFASILEFVCAEGPVNLVRNGNFEELGGYFPAGVLVTKTIRRKQAGVIPHWHVREAAPVEVISSLFWQSSLSVESLYAVHLNTRAGPGAIETKVSAPWGSSGVGTYRLSFDMAGNPNGGAAVKQLEVDVSPSECRPHRVSFTLKQEANSKRLNWTTVHLVLDVEESEPKATLKFRSLTPGAYGPIIDNVGLFRLEDDVDSGYADGDTVAEQLDFCRENIEDATGKTSIERLVEGVWMKTETWIRQRFARRID